ncbi:DUF5677 domain-containing protein [Mesorhizobium sp. LMG17149]|uniref:DUF5677 domain-containing protein n=1 Tax=unclassified Mesorhizobium TaxID=325217 RepID=UPI000FE8D2CF|nr:MULTISPECIES: DUF5677 domain-containing protein [unclassified Mesorhizobium]MCQ8875466.1 DUF5677 domain-containing protein [Mesorhizobium sp. LMG17149]RWQ15358.1 MAG: hypothetical protein EOR93_27110 [Mesorhizobium sp.]TIN30841.1 MAG: hypothetical protein E5Y31_05410 [Mesorhizobium sp.]
MSNLDQLKRLTKALTPMLAPLKEHEWAGPTQDEFFGLIQRAVLVRQWEGLQAQLALSSAGHGAFGVSLLRPSYEEMIWIEYLLTVKADASRILRLLGAGGAAKSVTQQAAYLGRNVSLHLGWLPEHVAFHAANGEAVAKELKVLKGKLGWDKAPPTFKWVSKAAGREKEYDFLYHATSSFVHFSVHELTRRIWGNKGKVTIGSGTFAGYWEEFACYWAARNFVNLMVATEIWIQDGSQEDEPTEILDIGEKLVPVPIVTREELFAWPDDH